MPAEADHGLPTGTELVSPNESLALGNGSQPVEIEATLAYEYPTAAPPGQTTWTRLEASGFPELAVDVQPLRVAHPGTSNPLERPGHDPTQTHEVAIDIGIQVTRSAPERGSETITLTADTSPNRFLASSEDTLELRVTWTGLDEAGDPDGSSSGEDEAGGSDVKPTQAGAGANASPAPLGIVAVLTAAAAAALGASRAGSGTVAGRREEGR